MNVWTNERKQNGGMRASPLQNDGDFVPRVNEATTDMNWMPAPFPAPLLLSRPGQAGMDSLSEAARMRWHLSEPRPWEAPSLEGVGHWLNSAGCIVELGQLRKLLIPRAPSR